MSAIGSAPMGIGAIVEEEELLEPMTIAACGSKGKPQGKNYRMYPKGKGKGKSWYHGNEKSMGKSSRQKGRGKGKVSPQ